MINPFPSFIVFSTLRCQTRSLLWRSVKSECPLDTCGRSAPRLGSPSLQLTVSSIQRDFGPCSEILSPPGTLSRNDKSSRDSASVTDPTGHHFPRPLANTEILRIFAAGRQGKYCPNSVGHFCQLRRQNSPTEPGVPPWIPSENTQTARGPRLRRPSCFLLLRPRAGPLETQDEEQTSRDPTRKLFTSSADTNR